MGIEMSMKESNTEEVTEGDWPSTTRSAAELLGVAGITSSLWSGQPTFGLGGYCGVNYEPTCNLYGVEEAYRFPITGKLLSE